MNKYFSKIQIAVAIIVLIVINLLIIF